MEDVFLKYSHDEFEQLLKVKTIFRSFEQLRSAVELDVAKQVEFLLFVLCELKCFL